MTNTTPPAVARGKLFAVAPMMDKADNLNKSMCCIALCALRVQ